MILCVVCGIVRHHGQLLVLVDVKAYYGAYVLGNQMAAPVRTVGTAVARPMWTVELPNQLGMGRVSISM
jgi:hypothetical protein